MKTIAPLLLAVVAAASTLRTPTEGFIQKMKDLAFARQPNEAVRLLEAERPQALTDTPEWLAAVSWAARGARFVERWDVAERYAVEAFEGSEALASERGGVDSSPHLATALGASIEVLAQVFEARGDKARAIQFLAESRRAYAGTSIETRIQKNYLLASLEGKPMPPLEASRWVGEKASLDVSGEVALFYFWAHWCADCKAQKPALFELHRKYASRGLRIIGPTRLYGYVAGGRAASPDEEVAYIEGAWQQRHPLPEWMPKPLSEANFVNFGVSTTPTLVLVDRQGVVRMYHPGKMTLDALEARVEPLL